jgi:nicotinate-nucleotide pyrophosphorylase (carboxylating)
VIVAREGGVMSGLDVLPHALPDFAPECELAMRFRDGDRVHAGQPVAVLSGPLREVLAAERTFLNVLGRLSGIATRTARFVEAIKGTKAVLLDTRKTTPGWRMLEKYGVRCGGGHLHRVGLYDAVLFKDNHIAGVVPKDLAEWVRNATENARRLADIRGTGLRFVELEVDSLEQLEAVLRAGVCDPGRGLDVILLDNMDVATLRRAIELRARHKSAVLFEASGGVTLETVRGIAETGVDSISVGGLTHHAVSLNVSMDVQ